MQVKLKQVRSFEVVGSAGRVEHMEQMGQPWNDMIELQDTTGRKLVLMRQTSALGQAISEAIGDGFSSWSVVSATPSLMDVLGFGDDPAQARTAEVQAPANTGTPGGISSDLLDDVVAQIRFERLTRKQQYAQLMRVAEAERNRNAARVEAMDTTGHVGHIETPADLCAALAGCIRRGA
jgi:hypothetical protein